MGQRKNSDNKKVQVAFRLPHDVVSALDEAVKARGESADRTSVVTEVLRAAFGLHVESPTPIQERVEALETKVEELLARLSEPTSSPPQDSPQKRPRTSLPRPRRLSDEGWMTPAEAFAFRGGDPENGASCIMSLDGTWAIAFNTFRLKERVRDYKMFGFTADTHRRSQKRPWLRPIPQ